VSKSKFYQKTSIALTERDLKLLQKLNAAGWLSTWQIRNYFFPGKSTNAVSKRLRKLVEGKFISLARTGSTEPGLYRLAGQGKLALLEHSQCNAEEIFIPTQLPRALRHFMAVNDLRFYFEQRALREDGQLLYFFSERELRRYYKHPHSISDGTIALLKSSKIIPDALAKLRLAREGVVRDLSLAIEYDAGTEHAVFFGKSKVKSYAALVTHHYEDVENLKVLTFADSIGRIVSLMRQTVQYQPPHHLFYFAAMEKLEDDRGAEADIFLDPYDFFACVRRGNRVEVFEHDIRRGSVPRHALITLPATSPRNISSRGESGGRITSDNATGYDPDSRPII
jgi:hypothetical protein